MADFINSSPEIPNPQQVPEKSSNIEYAEPGAQTPQVENEKALEGEKNSQELAAEQPSTAPQQQPAQSSHVSALKERVATPHTKSERVQEIELIMSDGLADIYSTLDVTQQQAVKVEGEKAANEIEGLIEQGAVVAKKVLSILRNWLTKIPGVNKFFLEQESKLKTDKIMAITRKTQE